MSEDKEVSRRWLLVWIGVLLNGAVALLIATPIVGYLLGPIRKNGGYDSWIDLGDISSISRGRDAAGQLRQPAEHALGWRDRQSGLLGSPHAGTEVPDFRHQLRPPWLPGALVSPVGTVHVPLPRRRLLWRWLAGRRAPAARPFRISLQIAKRQIDDRWRPDAYAGNQRLGAERELPNALAEAHIRLVRVPLEVGRADQGHGPPPGSDEHGQLVVCLWQRQFRSVNATDCHRDPAGHRLCSLCGRGLEQPAGVEPATSAGVVLARHAWLGIELHGGRGVDPHGAGIPVWRV